MQLHTLQLINFKNYESVKLDLSSKINVLVGKNGCGKTNLLDAIHYLSLTKSAFLSSDNYSIRHGERFFSIKGTFLAAESKQEVLCAVQAGSKKVLKEGVNEYQKLSDHIGKYPVVLIAPDDTQIVKEGSEERRKFFDSIISQLDSHYLNALIRYNHALKQRNGLLKMFAETNSFDAIALESYDVVLAETGSQLHKRRKDFITEFLPTFVGFYKFIVDHESVQLDYSSDLNQTGYLDGLRSSRQRDLLMQRTNFGVHRDDYVFTLANGDLKRLGSQGQQKSFIIALKLAQFEVIKKHKHLKPILLLDDIFDKLDDFRIQKLLELIKNAEFGQLFITDARPDRTTSLLKKISASASIFEVENGTVKQHEQ
jgi:DNA replication and repair protein RecF